MLKKNAIAIAALAVASFGVAAPALAAPAFQGGSESFQDWSYAVNLQDQGVNAVSVAEDNGILRATVADDNGQNHFEYFDAQTYTRLR